MVTQANKLYRKEALEQAASPEQLDQVIQVVSPKRWLSLIALGALVATGCAWSVFGKIPIVVTGQGVLVYPSKVVSVQSSGSGRILSLKVKVGDRVKKGQILATIDQSELQQQLELARNKRTQLQFQDQAARAAQVQRGSLDQIAIAQQQQALQQNLQTVQSLTPVLREKGLDSIQKERQTLQQRLQNLNELIPTFQERWQVRQQLFEQGAVAGDTVLQAKQEYLNAQAQLKEAESQLKQLDVKEADAQRQYLQNLNQTNELQAQLKALDTRMATQTEQDLTATLTRKKELQETERSISQLELQLKQTSQVVSDYDGNVLELTAKSGQRLEPGAAIGTIAAQSPKAELVNVVFLPVQEGKKVQKNMAVQVTPTIVKREEFGGIEGKVTEISRFPVTQQGAASLVGNPDILPGILSQGAHVAVFVKLQRDEAGSYRWSSPSKGPKHGITEGTTTTVQIRVEERTPISYVLPILKEWTGLG